LKIVAGTAKGRKLNVQKADLRPTSEKVKEALFDILREKVYGSYFLDLYAGTGGIGIEALSRGARKVIFVESNTNLIKTLRKNISFLGFENKAEVIAMDAGAFLKKSIDNGEGFDIIFLDPPYHTEEIDRIFKVLSGGNILSQNGILVAEHFKKKRLPEEVGPLRLLKEYRYGDTVLTLFKIQSAAVIPSEARNLVLRDCGACSERSEESCSEFPPPDLIRGRDRPD
jgi:16S rRNA (guanine(966)-N(2))-methyltransferase RsmD